MLEHVRDVEESCLGTDVIVRGHWVLISLRSSKKVGKKRQTKRKERKRKRRMLDLPCPVSPYESGIDHPAKETIFA